MTTEVKPKLPDDIKRQLLNQFESAFPKLEIELTNLLSQHENDLLDKSKVEDMLRIFNNRLIILQNEFRKSIQSNGKPLDISCCSYSDSKVADIAAGILGGGGAAAALSFISWTTVSTTWFIWTTTTTTTLGGLIGGALGVGAGVATAGVALLVGGATMFAVSKMRQNSRRNHIKKQILDHWKNKIQPELLQWAKNEINSIG